MSSEQGDIKIRWYRAEDYDAVEDLIIKLTQLFGDPFNKRWFNLYMEKRLMENVPGCYVAVHGDEVVGSIFCDILRDPTGCQYGYISNIMVKDEWRGKGIGKKLLEKAIHYLTLTGVPRIWANVREQTKEMVHLFEKNDFKRKFATYELVTPPYGI